MIRNNTFYIISFLFLSVIFLASCLKDDDSKEILDMDKDGIASSEDCNDLDASIRSFQGQSCDDGNAQTVNDVINTNCICLGESIDNSSQSTNEATLTSVTWKLTDAYSIFANGQNENLMNIIADCKSDDIHTFNVKGWFLVTEGPTSCQATDLEIVNSSKWQFANNETSLIIGTWERHIESLTDAKLVISEIGENGLKFYSEFTAQ